MKKFKFISVFILLITLITSLLVPCASAASDPDIQAKSAVLIEVSSGSILYSKNKDEKLEPASVTKIMTVLLAVEAIEEGKVSLNDMVTASQDIRSDLTDDGSTQNIQSGETMSLKDLMYCALVASANEACNIIAEYIGGTNEAFVAMMNERAQELGCTNTHFANAHGLTNKDHYTTAWDLYLIFNEAIKHDIFLNIIETEEYKTDVTNLTATKRELQNTNKLIDSESKYYYDYCLGGKTGSTSTAGYCLASLAEKDGVKLISIVLGAEEIEENGETETMSFVESARLFKWGFDNFSFQTVVSTTDLVKEIPVSLGDGANSVVLRPESDIVVYMDNAISADDFDKEYTIYNEETGEKLVAPIEEGQALGEMTVTYNGNNYGTVKLVANSSIDVSHFAYLKSQIGKFFSSPFVKIVLFIILLLIIAYIVMVVQYNKKRRSKNLKARKKKAIEQQQHDSQLSTGKSFEEIYKNK